MDETRQDEIFQVGDSGETILSLDTVFTALSNHRRRVILSYLTTCKYPIPFEELVEVVAMQETEGTSIETSDEVVRQITVDLYHIQLPKLADWGVIDYNQNLKLIRPAETLRPLEEYLRLAEQYDPDLQNEETQALD